MKQDPIIQELRAIRKSTDQMYREPKDYYEHLLKYQEQFKERF